jgi:riboflavin synthase
MFTGLVEEVGAIADIVERGGNHRITINAPNSAKELQQGNSVAVSGVCLTALDIKPASFCADLAAETWTRTSFSRITAGAQVNLELPLKADGRMGGHMVQGHVDGIGRLVALEPIPNADDFWLHIDIPEDLEKYVVFKGSISIEGISLTVAKLEGLRLTIAIIPHTIKMTNLGSLKPGDPVNIETDIVAKYLEKWTHRDEQAGSLTVERLVAQGF